MAEAISPGQRQLLDVGDAVDPDGPGAQQLPAAEREIAGSGAGRDDDVRAARAARPTGPAARSGRAPSLFQRLASLHRVEARRRDLVAVAGVGRQVGDVVAGEGRRQPPRAAPSDRRWRRRRGCAAFADPAIIEKTVRRVRFFHGPQNPAEYEIRTVLLQNRGEAAVNGYRGLRRSRPPRTPDAADHSADLAVAWAGVVLVVVRRARAPPAAIAPCSRRTRSRGCTRLRRTPKPQTLPPRNTCRTVRSSTLTSSQSDQLATYR